MYIYVCTCMYIPLHSRLVADDKRLTVFLLQVCDEKEQLTSDLDSMKRRLANGTLEGGVSSTNGGNSEELTHLKAQNAALQKSLQGNLHYQSLASIHVGCPFFLS